MIDRICSGMYNLKDILFRYYNSIKHFLDFFSLSNLSMYLYFYISASLSLSHSCKIGLHLYHLSYSDLLRLLLQWNHLKDHLWENYNSGEAKAEKNLWRYQSNSLISYNLNYH